jgi:hypothetical protein
MDIFTMVLMVAGAGFIGLAHYWFIMNTRYENHDAMGASVSFDQPFFIGAVLVAVAIGLRGILAWSWCIALFFGMLAAGLPYKWFVLDKIVGLFRRPNPKGD